MAAYYTQYQNRQAYSIPVVVNEWIPVVYALQVQSSYPTPVPQLPIALVSPQICPYTVVPDPNSKTILDVRSDVYNTPDVYTTVTEDIFTYTTPDVYTNVTPDVYSNIIPDVYATVTEDVFTNTTPDVYRNVSSEVYTNIYGTYKPVYTQEIENYIEDKIEEIAIPEQISQADVDIDETEKDPVEMYLTLPKELFPQAKMLNIDPNSIIDEFCKLPSVSENVSWILDIEYGVPRVPVTRSIAIYDVKYNSIHCKNTPTAIHPGFEKCNSDFKKVILFYYDCIVSTWYRGFIILNNDKSVENFHSWLLIPMKFFGMCWS